MFKCPQEPVKMDRRLHILGHEANLTDAKRREGVWCVPEPNGAKLEAKHRTEIGDFPDTWNGNNTLLNNPWVKRRNPKASLKQPQL